MNPIWYVGRARIGGPPSNVIRWVYVTREPDGTFSERHIVRLGQPKPEVTRDGERH